MRKEKVAPTGTPASMKPKKRGIAEQEQNGVIIPINAAINEAKNKFLPAKNLRILSGGK